MRISVINQSTGKYSTEQINGRPHVVTKMVVIEGDSVMNGLLYPQPVVAGVIDQLNMLPAPDGHPKVGGKHVSAFNPLAVNASNLGAFVRNPALSGNQVTADLCVDVEVAGKSQRGKRVLNRIKSGKRIGVSTGMIAQITNKIGKLGKAAYRAVVDSIAFDHVAILLDVPPAGENTYTLNHDKSATKLKKGILMDEITLDLTPLSLEDRVMISGLTLNEIVGHVKHTVTVDEAKAAVEEAGFKVNQLDQATVDSFIANEKEFGEFISQRKAKRDETVGFIVANSKMTAEQLAGFDDDALESLSQSVAPKNRRVMNGKAGGAELVLLDDNQLAKEA